jgi:hypothetical protein
VKFIFSQWDLKEVQAEVYQNTLTTTAGLSLSGTPALMQYAEREEVLFWARTQHRSLKLLSLREIVVWAVQVSPLHLRLLFWEDLDGDFLVQAFPLPRPLLHLPELLRWLRYYVSGHLG